MPTIDLTAYPLTDEERACLRGLLGDRERAELSLEALWALLDRVWYALGCSNRQPDWTRIQRYYEHPVWLLNGMFIEADPVSLQHRQAIADHIAARAATEGFTRVLDYGGGFGTLARLIAARSDRLSVDVLEPHPTRIGQLRVAELPRVSFVSSCDSGNWDVLVSTDVLEHVGDPLRVLCDMRRAVRPGGQLLLANNFEPCIQCHLPGTFHLRPSFELFAFSLGLLRVGRIEDSHAVIYRRTRASVLDAEHLRGLEAVSRRAFPVLDRARRGVQQLRARMRGAA